MYCPIDHVAHVGFTHQYNVFLSYFLGLAHIEATVGALVEILHAFAMCDHENLDLATKLYMKLLMSEDTQVSREKQLLQSIAVESVVIQLNKHHISFSLYNL